VLAIAYKDILNHKGRVKFINVPAHIEKIFCFVYLDRVFEICPDEDSAVRNFQEDKIISEIQKMQLRRRFKRLPLDIDVEFKPASSQGPFYRGKVLNISAVGLLVFADKTFPLGEMLDIKMFLSPKPGPMELEAKVTWLVQKEIQPQIYPAMGLEFHNLTAEKQEEIAEFVERNLPMGYPCE